MLVNPTLIAGPLSKESGSSRDEAPSTISQDGKEGDFTTQAALQIPRTLQSTDLVNSLAFYEVTFITSTTGAIDKIRMDFPFDTNIGASGVIEKVGIGGGTLLKAGSAITYDVTTPVSIPAGTFIRLEIFGIKNPTFPFTSFTATITTRDSGGNLVDGPSSTNVYPIKQIGTDGIANGAVTSQKIADGEITSTKPAESFMKRVILIDNAAGNARGWDPDGVDTSFTISEPAITCFNFSVACTFPSIFVFSLGNINHFCDVVGIAFDTKTFSIGCSSAPADNDELHYAVENLPASLG
jgi:hypothetical protein